MPSRRDTIRTYLLLLAGLTPLLSAGCAPKKVQAAVPSVTPPIADARPMTIAPDTDATPPLEAQQTAPSLPAPAAKVPVDLAESPVVPPPRRQTERLPENAEQDTSSRPEPPKIAPELSPSDQAAKQRQIEDDSAVATKNLQRVNNLQLNATQQDMADKIREALAEATDAGKTGDWVRAQNQAHRARSLSEALVQSL
ncbi:MAG TPA: hypothetical protein VIY69_12130 [Candidatus Acidoferrales bacterium]